MLSFIRYKSKEFIFLISLYSGPSKSKRYLSQLQTKVIHNDYTIHGKRHREEKELNRILPAYIKSDEVQYWYKNGNCHRDDLDDNGRVLPVIIWNDGTQIWGKNGKLHRDDRDENGRVLPAIIWSNGGQEWYKNGKMHRDDTDENGRVLHASVDTNGGYI